MALKVTFGNPANTKYVIEPDDLNRGLSENFEQIKNEAIEKIEIDLLSSRPDGTTSRVFDLVVDAASSIVELNTKDLAEAVTVLTTNYNDLNSTVGSIRDETVAGISSNLETHADRLNDIEAKQDINITVINSTSDFKTISGTSVIYADEYTAEIQKDHKHGDIILFNKQISSNLIDTSIAIYDKINTKWIEIQTLNNIYSANNVYFPDDLTITKTFGKYVVAEGSSTTLACKDKTFLEVFTDAFATGSGPIKTDPSLSVTFLDIAAKEVGSSLAVGDIGKIIIDIGKYETPDQATGVEFTEIGATVTCNDISVDCALAASSASTNSNINIAISPFGSWTDNGYTYEITGTGKSTDGITPKDSLNNANAAAQIKAKNDHESTVSKTLFKGYRAWFWGRMDTATDLDSNSIRALGPQKSRTTIDSLSSETLGGKIVIAIPTAAGKVITKVLLASNSDQDITSDFKQQQETVKVSGANNYNEVDYDVWVYQPADRDSSEEYKITIGNKEA